MKLARHQRDADGKTVKDHILERWVKNPPRSTSEEAKVAEKWSQEFERPSSTFRKWMWRWRSYKGTTFTGKEGWPRITHSILPEVRIAIKRANAPPAKQAQPADSPEVTELKRELRELQSPARPRTPVVIRKIQRVLEYYERPSSIIRFVKRIRGTICQLCSEAGFVMRNRKRYCEIHHLFHLSNDPLPGCLSPEYVVVLCANCHRRMHYAEVSEPVRTINGWRVDIDGLEHQFVTE
jgi:hypothetical protein